MREEEKPLSYKQGKIATKERSRKRNCGLKKRDDKHERKFALVAHRCLRRRAAIRESAEAQSASNGWPGVSMSMTNGA